MKIYLEIVKSKLPTNKPRLDYLVSHFDWTYVKVDLSYPPSYIECTTILLKGIFSGKISVLTRIPALPIPSLFIFFFLPNLSIEHHAIFESERNNSTIFRQIYSRMTLGVFQILCRFKVKNNICFSQEIADHVIKDYKAYPKSVFLTVNSHDPSPVLSDNRDPSHFTLAFMCGKFYPWQGLDLCISFVNQLSDAVPIKLHLIGQLNSDQYDLVKTLDYIYYHGFLSNIEVDNILSQSDVGLAPFALDRQGLSESSSLKSAYYLSRGIPVLSFFKDTRFHPSFYFYLANSVPSQSTAKVLEFLSATRLYSRSEVYSASVDLWSHLSILNKLDNLFH